MKTRLKICGIKRIEDVEIINQIKPDFIGFVFAESKRKIDLKTAIKLRKKIDSKIISVGVFVDEDIDNIVRAVKSKAIDIVQLHGNEDKEYIKKLKQKIDVKILKAIIVYNSRKINIDYANADFLLIDSGYGSGKTFDWNISINTKKLIFVAGGINIDNIEEAYKRFKPYAFDLSSSIEVEGYKDFNKIKDIKLKLDILNGEKNE